MPHRIEASSGAEFERYDTIVVGGGYFGCCLALHYREKGQEVLVLEASDSMLTRASYVNQARVHNGYHYPRSLLTALRSRVNFPRFVEDFEDCVESEFEKVYAIARNNSKVSAYQFTKFCETIGAPYEPAPPSVQCLFNPDLIEAVYSVTEFAFNSTKLREILLGRLQAEGVSVRTNSAVTTIREAAEGLEVSIEGRPTVRAKNVVVAAYARINRILHDSHLPMLPMKHEIAEVCLIEPAPELSKIGITVMDGPFFSTMPFPARHAFSLTHVRYTPHESWHDPEGFRDPYEYLLANPPEVRYLFMLKDAQRYLPAISKSRYLESLFEVKTILPQNEVDDGRPILFRKDYGFSGLSLVMGGKIDNIYDILHAIQTAEGRAENSNLSGSQLH